ncbi:MAG TPA: peptidoglycan recognition family protein [Micromonosporaceae bacterium]
MASSPDHPELNFVQAAGYTKGRPDGPPLWIVIHTMEASETGLTAEATARYFQNPADGRDVSAHYCVDADSIVACVKLDDTAWTVGNRPGNNRGINWELSGFARQSRDQWLDAFGLAMFARMAPYVVADAERFGIPLQRRTVAELRAFRPGITSHNDLRLAFGVTTHTDPGQAFPWDVFLATVEEARMPTVDEIWAKEYRDRIKPPKPDGTIATSTTGELLMAARVDSHHARLEAAAVRAVLEGLAGVNPDVAAILAGVDERLAQLRAGIRQDVDDELDEAIPPRPVD